MSYYPHNQPVGTVDGETEPEKTITTQSHTTGTLVPTATIAERSQTASPALGLETYSQGHVPLPNPPSNL
jgi:hypothetical protein